MKKILLIDDDNIFVKEVIDYFSKQDDYRLDYYLDVDINDLDKYEIIIIDLILNNIDSYFFIQKIRKRHLKIKIFVLSSINSSIMFKKLGSFDVDWLFIKPINLDLLLEHLQIKMDNYFNLHQYLLDLFNKIGYPVNLDGYQYMLYIIELVFKEHLEINEKLYLLIAKHFQKTVFQVERCLRYSIKRCFDRKDNSLLVDEIFGYNYSAENGQPKVLEFIHIIVNKIKPYIDD